MRPVRPERKPRASRGKEGRSKARAVSRAPAQPSFGRRAQESGNPFARLAAHIGQQILLRRPMLLMTLGLMGLAMLAALLASGVVARTVHHIDAAADAVVADAGFGIDEIHLAGNNRTPPEAALAALGFAPGQSIFHADLRAARARLMALPWVADAEVRRRYPGAIDVQLIEKLPFALWQSDRGLYVVERSGRVITAKNLQPFAHLPLLLGAGAPGAEAAELIDAASRHRAIAARIFAYQRVSGRRWNLILDDKVVVKLPETGWQKQLDVLERLIIDKGILERDITEIDLRSPAYFFFILKSGEQKKTERGTPT